MKYNFDEIIERKNTGSVKWDLASGIFGGEDLIPMWVADMDFKSPPVVVKALQERAGHGVFGYTACMDSYYNAIINWMKKRHSWNIERESVMFSPGIVPALNMLVRTFARPGDSVILQPPVYYPFMRAVKNNGCHIVNNPLELKNGKYEIDFADLEKKLKRPRVRMLIFCSPHNPVGRVWVREDIEKLASMCLENNVIMVSDEIHSDLVLNGHKHFPAGCLPDMSDNIISCVSPSKTFNLAGLHTSSVIITDQQKREAFNVTLENNGIIGPGVFGAVACEAAYTHGEEWLNQLLAYIEGNLDFIRKFINERLGDDVAVIEPEGTYLVWLDFRKLGLDRYALREFMVKKAKIALDEGYIFGQEGEGFERINIACPRSILKAGMERIEKAVNVFRGRA